jgi:hypothetical protein
MSLPLALTLCVGASQKSGQVLVRTYVLKHAEFPKVYWGMSGVLNLRPFGWVDIDYQLGSTWQH